MAQQFDESGVRFSYPENWQLELQETDDGWTASVQSPDTAFMVVTLREDRPDTEALANAALETMRQEYGDLEAEECVDSLAGQPAVGHDIRFFSFDLTNTCWTRSFYCDRGTVFVLCQLNDLETDRHEPVLRAMCASLAVTD